MVALRFEFTAGRYHGTPWGHHVNEGLVEWPPSPWRVLRALLAAGFRKEGWREEALPQAAHALAAALASELPRYHLPPAVVSHSRHYMPIGTKTTKVFDTFAHVGPAPLWVDWPAALSEEAYALLGRLVDDLPYLGRAESWVDGSLHEQLPADVTLNAIPSDQGDEAHDLVHTLAPLTPASYERWRGPALAEACQGLTKAKRRKVEALYPPQLTGSLLLATGDLQKGGWTRPPGAREVSYRVPSDALAAVPRVRGRVVKRAASRSEFALLSVTGDSERGTLRPQVSQALPLGELLHQSLAKVLSGGVCPALTGFDRHGQRVTGHRHAHLCPIDLDGDARIDHVLVWAPMGLDKAALRALGEVRFTYDRERGRWAYLTLAGFGDYATMRRALGGGPGSPLGESRRWRSSTPFIAPRHLKSQGRHTLTGQVLAELESRGLPPAEITVGTKEAIGRQRFYRFVRARRGAKRRPPDPRPWHLTLSFAEPRRGPLTLGYGSHFGLGQFLPVASGDDG